MRTLPSDSQARPSRLRPGERLRLHATDEGSIAVISTSSNSLITNVSLGGNAQTPVLDPNGVFLIPDILANSGGVVVSHLEWVQNLERLYWTEEEVNGRLEDKITKAFSAVYKESVQRGVSMRTAALIVGVGRVTDSVRTLGIWP